jgi:membrane-bound metal-dependent hydrolase YbcI (DUF457 family)
MQPQSHFLMTALAGKQLQQQGIPVRHKAWLLGSVLPDVPLALLTLGGILYYRWFNPTIPTGEVHELLHFQLFFTDPWWIASHNFFHSLVIGGLLLALGWFARRKQRQWGIALVWFAAATLFHTGIDIFTHHSDGPVFLFPLTWSYRFQSPISYWETAYYSRQFAIFEMALDGVILLYLAGYWWRKRLKRSSISGN